MKICTALLDEGYNEFSLTILEICDASQQDYYDFLLVREKHYFEVYDPQYNTAETPTRPGG